MSRQTRFQFDGLVDCLPFLRPAIGIRENPATIMLSLLIGCCGPPIRTDAGGLVYVCCISATSEVNQKRSVQITDPSTSVPSSTPGQTNVAYDCCLFNLASHNTTRISSASTERYVTNGWTNISFNQSHMSRRQRHNGCGVTIPSDRTWQSAVSRLIKRW